MTGEFKRDNIVISTVAHRFKHLLLFIGMLACFTGFIGSVMEKSLNFVYKIVQRSLHSAVLRSR